MVHIIIVNWRGWRDTLACIASLKALRYAPYEIVIVDNGSNDDSVSRIRGAHPSLTVLETGCNMGFAGGNNVGVRFALSHNARYVWLLNNDTLVDPNALHAMLATAEQDTSIGAVGTVVYDMARPHHVQVWGGGQVNMWLGRARYCIDPIPAHRLDYVTGASMLVRSDVFERIGLLDEGFFMYWEDTDFAFRLRRGGYRLAVSERARVWHKESASIGKGSAALDTYFNASAARFFRRYAPAPILPIVLGAGGKILKRIFRRDWEGIRAVWNGARGRTAAVTAPPVPPDDSVRT